jgi:hypothetical protein
MNVVEMMTGWKGADAARDRLNKPFTTMLHAPLGAAFRFKGSETLFRRGGPWDFYAFVDTLQLRLCLACPTGEIPYEEREIEIL